MADVLHVALRNSTGVAAFDARLFQVPFPDGGRHASHLVGICRGPDRPAAAPFAMDSLDTLLSVQFSDAPPEPGPRSSVSFDLPESSAGTSCADGGGAVRATVDVLCPRLVVNAHNDAWAAHCGTDEDVPNLHNWLGDEAGSKFIQWLQ